MDGLLIYSQAEEEHLKYLEQVLRNLEKQALNLKCQSMSSSKTRENV